MTTTNRILFTEGEWMASTLSIARWTGGARINGHAYQLDRKYMVLIRSDYRRLLRPLGVDTIINADKRYGTGRKSKNILLRLYHIIATEKRLQREKQKEI